LAFSKAQKRVELVGGTHVALAPPFQYFSEVFLPIAQRMGFKATAKLKRYGFYPAGGGIAEMTVDAVSELKPINLLSRGKLKELKILSVVSNLPPTLAKKQAIALKKKLAEKGYVARIQESKIEAEGNASFLFLQAKYANSVAGFSALGEVGKTAEQVAGEVANAFFAFEESDACVDEYLGDQLILPMALAKRRSSMRVLITRHLLTNIFVAEKFLSVLFKVRGREGEIGEVTVNGAGFTR
jgi:RNA 3'-terminal phosphate cyclase (ATP)